MGGKGKPDKEARPSRNQETKAEAASLCQQIGRIGVHSPCATAAPRSFRLPSGAEAAQIGARQKAIEAHPLRRRVRVHRRRHMPVMHQPVCRCVMRVQHRRIDRDAKPVEPTVAPMNQLMRGGV